MIRSMVADEMYYPGKPDELRRQLHRSLSETSTIAGAARVVIGPYGAYDLTLPYVIPALKAAARVRPQVILVIAPPNAPSKRVLLPESDAFATPFGTLPVARELLQQLTERSTLFEVDEFSHLRDHSIETMLPALHVLFGPVPIIPILVGRLAPAMLNHAAQVIAGATMGTELLTVVSANLSGFTTPDQADARARGIIRLLLDAPGEKILQKMETLDSPPRSLWPIVLGHLLAGAHTRPLVLDRGTFETEFEGDTGSVVLAAIAYT